MHNARLPTVCARPPDVNTSGGPQTNKFEKGWGPGDMSDVGGGGGGGSWQCLYSKVQCIMSIGHMGIPLRCEQTDSRESITLIWGQWQRERIKFP